jgi:hypothetical protein
MDQFNAVVRAQQMKIYAICAFYIFFSAFALYFTFMVYWPFIVVAILIVVFFYFGLLKENFEILKVLKKAMRKRAIDKESALEYLRTEIKFIEEITHATNQEMDWHSFNATDERKVSAISTRNKKGYEKMLGKFKRLETILLEEVLQERRENKSVLDLY